MLVGAQENHFHAMNQERRSIATPMRQSITLFFRHYKKDFAIALAVFLIAFLVRVIYVSQLRSSPLFDEPVMDELYHDQWAQAIADGKQYIDGPYFRAPLYPAMLGMIYKIFGHDYLIPRIVQAILGSLSCVIVFFLGRSLFNRITGAFAATAAATYWILIYHDAELLIAPLIVFLDLLLIWFLTLGFERRRRGFFWAAGIALGLSAIARPNILLLAPAIALWIAIVYWNAWRNAVVNIAIVAIGTLAMIAPVTLRNHFVGHDFVAIASQGGVNFYIGNNPHSDGRTAIVPGTPGGWWEGYHASIARAEQALGKKLKPSEVSRYYYSEGWKFIRQHPGPWLQLTLLKLRLWWSRWEIPNDKGIDFITEEFTPIVRWLPLSFGMIAPLGIVGMILCWRRRLATFPLWGFILCYSLSFLPFFCTSRYRVPIIPPLLILAVVAAWEVLQSIMGRNWKRLGLLAMMAGASVALVHITPATAPVRNDAFDLVRIGNAYVKKGRLAAAEDTYRRAVALTPYYLTARINLGGLYMRMNRIDEAIHQFRSGLSSQVRLSGESGALIARTHFLLAQALDWRGESSQAQGEYELAAARHSIYREPTAPTRAKIAAIRSCLNEAGPLFQQQRFGEAAAKLQGCSELDPENQTVLDFLIHALIRSGQLDRAVQVLEKKLSDNQEWAAANLAMILSIAPDPRLRNPPKALKYGRLACPNIEKCGAFFLDALAVAVAENGKMDEGIRLTKLALQRAKDSPNPNDRGLADMINSRLDVYQSGRPFRLPIPAQSEPPMQTP